MLGPVPRYSHLVRLGTGRMLRIHICNNSQVMLKLPPQGPNFENHRTYSNDSQPFLHIQVNCEYTARGKRTVLMIGGFHSGCFSLLTPGPWVWNLAKNLLGVVSLWLFSVSLKALWNCSQPLSFLLVTDCLILFIPSYSISPASSHAATLKLIWPTLWEGQEMQYPVARPFSPALSLACNSLSRSNYLPFSEVQLSLQ